MFQSIFVQYVIVVEEKKDPPQTLTPILGVINSQTQTRDGS